MDDGARSDAERLARPLRVGFAGTPPFAATVLTALLERYPPLVVYTQPDRPAGRGRRLQPSAVKAVAVAHGISVRQPPSLRVAAEEETLRAFALDALIVAAYGLLLPPAILRVPTIGCINVHASLLPRWRGAAPVERAIMAGDEETGVCIMHMDEGLDTGPVYLQLSCPISRDTDGPGLEARLADLGAKALLHCLDGLPGLHPQPQGETGITYAAKLTRRDAEIDWNRPALEIERQVRALRGRMPAFSTAGATRMNVLDARVIESDSTAAPGTVLGADSSGIRFACGARVLSVQRLKLNVGKGQPLTAADALNGYGRLVTPGTRFGPRAESAAEPEAS
jgi:methionyl-tRNA formyltransferase